MQLAITPYRFASHVHVCKTGRDVVMLDLKRDRYFGIDPADAEAMSPLVAGVPASIQSSEAQETQTSKCPLLQELIDDGAVIANAEELKLAAGNSIQRPEIALINGYVDIRTDVRAIDVVRVLASVAVAGALMRWCSLDRIARRVASIVKRADRSTFDNDLARQRIAVFNRVRPFLYTSAEACLFSSLAMQSFLARDLLFPQFVFGVATRPFRAHCWLQHRETVVNDTPENVREYTPILVI